MCSRYSLSKEGLKIQIGRIEIIIKVGALQHRTPPSVPCHCRSAPPDAPASRWSAGVDHRPSRWFAPIGEIRVKKLFSEIFIKTGWSRFLLKRSC
jgi:hypothetical protein